MLFTPIARWGRKLSPPRSQGSKKGPPFGSPLHITPVSPLKSGILSNLHCSSWGFQVRQSDFAFRRSGLPPDRRQDEQRQSSYKNGVRDNAISLIVCLNNATHSALQFIYNGVIYPTQERHFPSSSNNPKTLHVFWSPSDYRPSNLGRRFLRCILSQV